MSESEKISRRQPDRVGGLRSGQDYAFEVKLNYQGYLLEVEDAHFHLDSAVLLPDYGQLEPDSDQSPDQNRITGLAILYACYRHAKEHPEQHALVVGHTDRSGSERYNQTLSELRARNVRCAIQGNRTGWVEVANEKHTVEDYQQILRWITFQLGWDCNPGPKDGKEGRKTRQGVRDFQEQYNQRFGRSIQVDGIVGREVWEAFFDVYMRELQHLMGTDEEGVQEARKNMHFLECPSIGCGEHFPITPDRRENYRDPVDRRVEILFFDPGEEPPLDCEAHEATCEELYRGERYSFEPIPAEPLPLPSGVVPVHLDLAYTDPEGEQRTWPEGSSVVIAYDDGVTEEKVVSTDGALQFQAREVAFTMQFPSAASKYVAVSPPDSGKNDEIIEEGHVDKYHDEGWRVFKLPAAPGEASAWALPHSDWTAKRASNFEEGTFQDMDTVDRIGSEATPVQLVLDPHWLFVRFEFFDRVYGHSHHDDKRVSIPPVLLDGYRQGKASSSPDTRSNWTVFADEREKTCQALPWIVQRGPDGTERPKPDADVLLRFETSSDTFVVSEDEETRRLQEVTDAAKLEPGPERLKYYDMPVVWQSQRYFARPKKGEGKAFEDLSDDQIEASVVDPESPVELRPLVFSLDDVVLTDENHNPISWEVGKDRAAIFSHKFAYRSEGNFLLSNYGLYKPDWQNNKSYLTEKPTVDTARNDIAYISDYPDWTRLVVAQGNLFDVFNQRLPDGDSHPVGARAAVRWVEATRRVRPSKYKVWESNDDDWDLVNDPNALVSPGRMYFLDHPDPITPQRPDGTDHSFFIIQPFFAQHYKNYKPDDPPQRGGRFDMVLLRCCDVEDEKEIALNLQYFRYVFNFEHSDTPDNLKKNPEERRKFEDDACRTIAKRWTGPPPGASNPEQGTYKYNKPPARIVPEDPDSKHQPDPDRPLRVRPFYFVQTVEETIAHFKIDVVKEQDVVRPYMNRPKGKGRFEAKDDEPENGEHLGAHETGHAAALEDEYIENEKAASYLVPGFEDHIPGLPYAPDDQGMMNGNKYIRARYLWHVAEWLRALDEDRDYFVEKGDYTYSLPHHPDAPDVCLVNWPLDERIDLERGSHGNFDLFLYPLGEDGYSQGDRGEEEESLVDGENLDGILMIIVKIKLIFTPDKDNRPPKTENLYKATKQARQKINRILNGEGGGKPGGRFYAQGEFGSSGSWKHWAFDKCAIRFSPRVLGATFPRDELLILGETPPKHPKSYAEKVGVLKKKKNRDPPPDKEFDYKDSKDAYEEKVADIEGDHPPHFEIEVPKGKSPSADWDPSDDYKLTITCTYEEEWWNADNFGSFGYIFCNNFPRMVGVDEDLGDVRATDLKPIVQDIIPGASVKTF